MSSTFRVMKAVVATVVSLWMAVFACVMGCRQPGIVRSHKIAGASSEENLANHSDWELMANMENCHHSGGNSPAQPNDGKHNSNGASSCCSFDITITPKWDTTAGGIGLAHDFVVASDFDLAVPRFSEPVELVPFIGHSGRDTLLETHLLRI